MITKNELHERIIQKGNGNFEDYFAITEAAEADIDGEYEKYQAAQAKLDSIQVNPRPLAHNRDYDLAYLEMLRAHVAYQEKHIAYTEFQGWYN